MNALGKFVNRSARILVQPVAEPVTLADAKRWCNVDDDIDGDDGIVSLVITAARRRAEFLTGRAFVPRMAELVMDDLPCDGSPIWLPFAPLIGVSYLRYTDSGGVGQELSGSPDPFLVDTRGEPGRIAPLANGSWPSTNGTISNVRIGFTCGYLPDDGSPTDYASNVPAEVKLWLQQRVVTYYDNRGAIDLTNVTDLPRDFVDGLLDGLRVDFGMA